MRALPARVQYERYPGAAGAPLAPGYRRREPENSALHAIVRDHLETFLAEPQRHDGDGYPVFLEREFRRYLDCRLLARGFARLRCPDCHFERLVAFSCKGRLCPSCMERRMADIAASLVDELLPESSRRGYHTEHPERFLRGAPRVAAPPKEVWINKPRLVQLAPSQRIEIAR